VISWNGQPMSVPEDQVWRSRADLGSDNFDGNPARPSGVSRELGCLACRILPKDHDRRRRPDLVRDKLDESPPAGFSRKLAISVADPLWNRRPAARNHDPVRMCQLTQDAEPVAITPYQA